MATGQCWIHPLTLTCAEAGCIPCLYKIFPLGRVEGAGLSLPPNKRPETCPRSRDVEYQGLYRRSSRVDAQLLTVGDGDFSFSLSVARGLSSRSEASEKSAGSLGMIATSHESLESISSTYKTSKEILRELQELLPHRVLHEVDATELSSNQLIDSHAGYIEYIIWNFPCVASHVSKSADGQVKEIDENKQLLRRFFTNAHRFLKKTGEIHVTHKTIEPFSWWGILELAESSGLALAGSVVFDRCLYPGYTNRKVKDSKSFPLHDARTFVFRMKNSKGKPPAPPRAVAECGLLDLDDDGVKARLIQLALATTAVGTAPASSNSNSKAKKERKQPAPESASGQTKRVKL